MNRRCVVADEREIFACPLHAADFMRVEQGVVTRSEGEDPRRRIIVAPADADADAEAEG